ncbi:hypothetical protein LOD99_6623 [Oopsacas minuta]|uniref:Uncharacterized protein n=1 Tax=Oopsacas minuta TaxID=111878 RepID=A0AAV7JL97_9METZ|nr:hypothetical protein LOD99_6623 [Oopsacas minuta]
MTSSKAVFSHKGDDRCVAHFDVIVDGSVDKLASLDGLECILEFYCFHKFTTLTIILIQNGKSQSNGSTRYELSTPV